MPEHASAVGFIGAMLPFWPLLAALAVGVALAAGKLRALSDKFVVAGVGLSAVSAIYLLLAIENYPLHAMPEWSAPEAGHVEANAAAEGHAADEAQGDQAHAAAEGWRFGTRTLFRWISLGDGQWANISFFVDPLTGWMLATVCFVSLMVVIYSQGYMRDHHGRRMRGYERYFAWLGLFVFSMCTLVLAGNFVLLYLGWELVGLCSYLLIGFFYERPSAAAAAKKAFIVNRIGDFGFALGIFALYLFIHPHVDAGQNALDYTVVFEQVRAGALTSSQATLVSLLLFCGAIGKSAQFPLYVWLPDAMEGPSPVSALIHAATMVTAGVYMVARCGVIFAASPIALNVVALVGGFTALFAATMAMAQFDMKRILAYSTISQLAYMFAALGAGAPEAAVFHLYTHAFFKALLFLAAGSVMHAMGDVIDLRKFSGLRSVLPKTYWLTLIGCLALAGFPLLSGFWSKDEIVHAAFESNLLLGLVLLATAGLTAYYTFRMFFLCFHGRTRTPPEAGDHPHESPPVMVYPMAVLAAGAVLAGYVGVSVVGGSSSFLGLLAPHGWIHSYLGESTVVSTVAHGEGVPWLMYVSALVAVGGIALAWLRYGDAPRLDPDEAALGRLWRLWGAKYYVDEIYNGMIVQPLRLTGRFFFGVDQRGVDGLVHGLAWVPVLLGAAARTLQRGSVQGYGLGMVVGVTILLVIWLVAGNGGA